MELEIDDYRGKSKQVGHPRRIATQNTTSNNTATTTTITNSTTINANNNEKEQEKKPAKARAWFAASTTRKATPTATAIITTATTAMKMEMKTKMNISTCGTATEDEKKKKKKMMMMKENNSNNHVRSTGSNRRNLLSAAGVLFVSLSLMSQSVSAQQCTVCADGDPVPDPGYPIKIDGVPANSCGELDVTVGFLPAVGDLCDLVHAFGPVCGCAVPANACELCGAVPNSRLTQPTFVLEGVTGADLPIDNPSKTQVTVVNCEVADSLLQFVHLQGSAVCTEWQQKYAQDCGCLAPTSAPTNVGAGPTAPTTPAPTPAPKAASNEFQCTLCADGTVPPLPSHPVRLGNIPAESCGQVDSKIDFVMADSLACEQLRTLGPVCGCASTLDVQEAKAAISDGTTEQPNTEPPQERCPVCHDSSAMPHPEAMVTGDRVLNSILPGGPAKGLIWYCELLEGAMQSYTANSQVCTDVQTMLSQQCGCPAHPNSTITGDVPIVMMPERAPEEVTIEDTSDAFSGRSKSHLIVGMGLSILAAVMVIVE